ncbi:hypothetical protein DSO57_1017791 [Entomophthora muscae]|uniref:Uncharacterized protein n=1 Tax=Entomophthora muscae TaxID=34485 RepID=A0ACC2RVS6_9FUNG|nr:hypothetical protein DSO57_1017791 [Entomophthora muscae]
MMILYDEYLNLVLDSLSGSSHPLLPSSCVITNLFPVILDSHELYNHYLSIKIIIYLLNIFPIYIIIDTFKSPTVLITIHGPLGKIKVLALLDTGANANFIEEKLAKLIGLSASGSLDVKVGNSTIIGATPIL